MMKVISKTLLATAVLAAVSLCATAAETSAPPVDMSVLEKVEAKLHASSASLREHKVTLDDSAEEYQKRFGKDYVPVLFTGRRFLLSSSGDALFDPQGVYMVSTSGPVRMSDELVKLDMSLPSADKWPSLSLPEGVQKRGDLFVISDPTCGYCHKVDAEAERYLANGIQVHYIPYPRSGIQATDQPGFSRWAAAACAENPGQAYHDISLGKLDQYPVPTDMNAPCVNVVREGFEYGRKIGVTGTPYMYAVSVDGATLANPGYMPIEHLSAQIGVFIKPDAAAKFAQ